MYGKLKHTKRNLDGGNPLPVFFPYKINHSRMRPFDLSKALIQHSVRQKIADLNIVQRLQQSLYVREEQLQLLFEVEALGKVAQSCDIEEELSDAIALLCGHIEAFPECWNGHQAIAKKRLAKSIFHPLSIVWALVAGIENKEYSM